MPYILRTFLCHPETVLHIFQFVFFFSSSPNTGLNPHPSRSLPSIHSNIPYSLLSGSGVAGGRGVRFFAFPPAHSHFPPFTLSGVIVQVFGNCFFYSVSPINLGLRPHLRAPWALGVSSVGSTRQTWGWEASWQEPHGTPVPMKCLWFIHSLIHSFTHPWGSRQSA